MQKLIRTQNIRGEIGDVVPNVSRPDALSRPATAAARRLPCCDGFEEAFEAFMEG